MARLERLIRTSRLPMGWKKTTCHGCGKGCRSIEMANLSPHCLRCRKRLRIEWDEFNYLEMLKSGREADYLSRKFLRATNRPNLWLEGR